MTEYNRKDLKWTDSARLAFGAHVELEEENGKSHPYELLAEFEVHGRSTRCSAVHCVRMTRLNCAGCTWQ